MLCVDVADPELTSAFCAAINSGSSFAVQTEDSRSGRDAARLALDRALLAVYPMPDMRRFHVATERGRVVVRIESAVAVHTVNGVAYGVENGAVTLLSPSAVACARRSARNDLHTFGEAVVCKLYADASRPVVVAPHGVIFNAEVVASCALYMYVGLRQAAGGCAVVARVPVTDFSRGVSLGQPPDVVLNPTVTKRAQKLCFFASPRAVVALVGHRLVGSGAAFEVEDVAVVSCKADAASTCDDVKQAFHEASASCVVGADGNVDSFIKRLRNVRDDTFRRSPAELRSAVKARDAAAAAATARSGGVVSCDESETVEFKYTISDDTSGLHQTNEERTRQILCGFANCQGGALVIGVADDGAVAGWNARDASIRTTKFAPAMATQAIVVVELPIAAGDAKRTEWWKTDSASANSSTQVLSCYSVLRGAAPFHLPGSGAPCAPPLRGFASTLTMSVTLMVDRIVTWEAQRMKRARDDAED